MAVSKVVSYAVAVFMTCIVIPAAMAAEYDTVILEPAVYTYDDEYGLSLQALVIAEQSIDVIGANAWLDDERKRFPAWNESLMSVKPSEISLVPTGKKIDPGRRNS